MENLESVSGDVSIDVFHEVLGGQPTPCVCYNTIRAKQFFTLPVVNDKEIVRTRSASDGVEVKSVFGASKLLAPTGFAISGY